MKPINREELYNNLSEFLKTRGVSLQDGSYSRGIHAGCSFLADAINLSQAGLHRAKSEIEKQLDQARQIIHEKTAPGSNQRKSKPAPEQSKPGAAAKGQAKSRRQNPNGGSKTKPKRK